jgi:YidC/Oxa1 family membrane protein insertase
MNSRRLWIVLMLAGAVAMGVSFYLYRTQTPAVATAADANAATAPVTPAPATGNSAPESGAAEAHRMPPVGVVATSSAPSTLPAPAEAPASAPTSPREVAPPAPFPAPAPAPTSSRPQFFQTAQGAPQWFTLGSLDPEANYPFRLDVTTEGAAVGTLKLTGFYATVADKKLAAHYGRDHARYEQEAAAHPAQYGGNYSLLNPVEYEDQRFLPLATRRIDVWMPGSADPVGWNLDRRQWQLVEGPALQPDGSQTIRFAWTIAHDPNFADGPGPAKSEPLLKVIKTYTVRKGDYSVAMALEVVNESNLALKVSIAQAGPAGVPPDDASADVRQVIIGKVKDAEPYPIFKPRTHLPTMRVGLPVWEYEAVGYSQEEGRRTLWLGEASKFFASILYPHPVPPEANMLGWPEGNLQFSVAAAVENPVSRCYLTCVTIGVAEKASRRVDAPVELAPRGTFRAGFDVFAGPKKRELFSDESAPGFGPLYKNLNYLGTIEFGSCCSWGPLTLGMMWLLQFLSKIALGNYGVAIILLVVLVRLVMHPLTKKGQVMMSKTQKMGPAMEKLKAKYADDKEHLQKEMMKVYKQQGFTPLLGCLPMMLQLPIWAALWSALNAAVELRQAAFLPIWLTDLSAPDAIWHFSYSLPIIGSNLNLLPILGCISTFFQMKFTPQGAPATTPEQAKQQAMMKYMMPVMMAFMFYSMPSGLNLYIMASGFFAAGEQYVIRKHIREKEEAAASTMTVVEAGKAPRGSRVRKPKGPFGFKRG